MWVVGLHVTEENQIDALDMFGVQTWYINGRRAFKYAGTGAFGEYITVGSFGKETTWLYFVTDELPAEGVSSIGMTFHQTNRNYKKYCPVTVTVTSDIPLDGKGRQSMYAGALHTSIAVDGIELIDEPAW